MGLKNRRQCTDDASKDIKNQALGTLKLAPQKDTSNVFKTPFSKHYLSTETRQDFSQVIVMPVHRTLLVMLRRQDGKQDGKEW